MSATRIGPYVVRIDGDRLSVSRPGLLAWLGLQEPRPILSALGFAAVRDVAVSRRELRGPEARYVSSARPWQVEVFGQDGQRLCRAFRFRLADQAQAFSALIRSFANAT